MKKEEQNLKSTRKRENLRSRKCGSLNHQWKAEIFLIKKLKFH